MVVEAEELARRMRQKMEDVRFADKTIMGQIYYDYGEIDLIDDHKASPLAHCVKHGTLAGFSSFYFQNVHRCMT